jgi:putative hemolysin
LVEDIRFRLKGQCMFGLELGVMVVMIAINSIFAAYEIALASLSLPRLKQLAQEQAVGALAAVKMKENMEGSLAVVQLGITLVGAIAAAVGGAGADQNIAPVLQQSLGLSSASAEFLAIALVVFPLTIVTIIFGELIPKVFALRNAEWVCLRLSPMMRGFALCVRPAVITLETIVMGIMSLGQKKTSPSGKSEAIELQELRASAAVARASLLIGQREEGIILAAAQIKTRPVREILLPSEHIRTLDVNASFAENLIAAHLDMHTRFPVVQKKGNPQTIVGYVNVKDIIAAMRLNPKSPTMQAIVRPLVTLNEKQTIAESLEALIRERSHIAIIKNDTGRVMGMITLEDIMEELVGSIEDEYDRLPSQVMGTGAGWVVGGAVAMDRLSEVMGKDMGGKGMTVSEWFAGQLGARSTGRGCARKGRRANDRPENATRESRRGAGERGWSQFRAANATSRVVALPR